MHVPVQLSNGLIHVPQQHFPVTACHRFQPTILAEAMVEELLDQLFIEVALNLNQMIDCYSVSTSSMCMAGHWW